MEHPDLKGYDYEKVREKMLRSWGKTTGAVPEKKEKTDNEDQSEKKFFKVKNKSVKIKNKLKVTPRILKFFICITPIFSLHV
mgnify:CR=1 FL=1